MTKCGCEQGNDCTKITVCQCELVADKLAEALEALVANIEDGYGGLDPLADAQAALKEYKK